MSVYEKERDEREYGDEEQKVTVTTVSYTIPTLENDEPGSHLSLSYDM